MYSRYSFKERFGRKSIKQRETDKWKRLLNSLYNELGFRARILSLCLRYYLCIFQRNFI